MCACVWMLTHGLSPRRINRNSVAVAIAGEIRGGHCPRLGHHPSPSAPSAQVWPCTGEDVHCIHCTCERSQRRVIKTTRTIKPSLKVLAIDSVGRGCSTTTLDQNEVDWIYPRECFTVFYAQKQSVGNMAVSRHAHECVH